jgi:hypothetical protein
MISVEDFKGYGFDQKINECKNRSPCLRSFGKVIRTREVEGKTSIEEKYYFLHFQVRVSFQILFVITGV